MCERCYCCPLQYMVPFYATKINLSENINSTIDETPWSMTIKELKEPGWKLAEVFIVEKNAIQNDLNQCSAWKSNRNVNNLSVLISVSYLVSIGL